MHRWRTELFRHLVHGPDVEIAIIEQRQVNLLAAGLPACKSLNNTQKGTGIGVAAGATAGALIGGGVGAVGGAVTSP